MSVVVIGLEHHQAPLGLLERVAISESDLHKVLGSLRDQANIEESVLLSTCLRTEVYAVVDRFHDAVTEVQEVLADKAGLDQAELADHLTIRFDDDVTNHLFSVASGLESAVLGESEVLGQVRRSFEQAQDERVSGPVLSALFRHALETGKRVRSETGISRGTTSFAYAAVELAEARLDGGLAGRNVVIFGAGEMGAGVYRALTTGSAQRRPASITVVNRSAERADLVVAEPPADVSVRSVRLDEATDAFSTADVVLAAVETGSHIVDATHLAPEGDRERHPVLVVDLGMPRNVDPDAAHVPGVTLLDMDDLTASVDHAVEGRREEATRARQIVVEETDRYRTANRERGAAPMVAALRARLEGLRTAELDHRRAQLADLTEAQWEQVDAATRAALNKLLHEPTLLLKETAGTPRGDRLVEALRILFDL